MRISALNADMRIPAEFPGTENSTGNACTGEKIDQNHISLIICLHGFHLAL